MIAADRDLSHLQPAFRRLLEATLALAKKSGLRVFVTEGFRSFRRQQQLYDQGRSAPGRIVTKAGPGQSIHQYALAADLAFLDPAGKAVWSGPHAPWQRLADIAKQNGLEWGGDWSSFKDRPHFQLPGYSWRSCLARWPQGWKPGHPDTLTDDDTEED